MNPGFPKIEIGSTKNQPKTGDQISYPEFDEICFINSHVKHEHLAKAQNEKLDEAEKWLKNYPAGIDLGAE